MRHLYNTENGPTLKLPGSEIRVSRYRVAMRNWWEKTACWIRSSALEWRAYVARLIACETSIMFTNCDGAICLPRANGAKSWPGALGAKFLVRLTRFQDLGGGVSAVILTMI